MALAEKGHKRCNS